MPYHNQQWGASPVTGYPAPGVPSTTNNPLAAYPPVPGPQYQVSGPPPTAPPGIHDPSQLYMSKNGFSETGSVRPRLSPNLSATCPMLCHQGPSGLLPLPIQQLKFDVKCHISTAFVEVELTCLFPRDWPNGPITFVLPKTQDTTITELGAEVPGRPNMYATALVPSEDVSKQGWAPSSPAPAPNGGSSPFKTNDPELFFLPFALASPGDTVVTKVHYFQPMEFSGGQYTVRLPSSLPQQCMSPGGEAGQILSVNMELSSGLPEPPIIVMRTHNFNERMRTAGACIGEVDKQKRWSNEDVVFGYQVWSKDLTTACNVQLPTKGALDQRGTFCVSIAPPPPEVSQPFARNIVFIIDRSGSMGGTPMTSACQALQTGLSYLTPADRFTVVAFDHEQLWWNPLLQPATPDSIAACRSWVSSTVTARGLTNIYTPLNQALDLLLASGGGALPCVFLLTDGAVDNERQICNDLAARANQFAKEGRGMLPRIYTFGIGEYCNHFFLKQLAIMGRGLSDFAFRPTDITRQMQRLLFASAAPVLTNIVLEMAGLSQVELFPFPIPDLFCNAPVLVTGKFSGTFPHSIRITGQLPSGQIWSRDITPTPPPAIPLSKVFAKQQLDNMTANAWLHDNNAQEVRNIVNLSVQTGVPCAHTQLVGFPTTQDKFKKMQEQKTSGKPSSVSKYAVGAIVVVAGVTAALAFGSVAATLANTMMDGGSLGAGFAAMGNDVSGCCDGCGDCGDCGDCGCCQDGCGGCDMSCCECGACCEGDIFSCLCSALCSLVGDI